MLDTTTKKRIDDCRDILVGKLPDPKAQIEQITIALIYKFMDDMDKEAIDLGGKAKFFSGSYEKYSWDNLFDTKVTASEMLSLYSDAIASMDKNPNIPQLFRDIFKNAFLPYRDPETLKLFLKTIGEFEYTHSEKLGDAFEYLLSVMGSQGDAGQFRTPRHIIDFLVAVVDPQKTDTILDPACGTAGFLISAFKYIMGDGGRDAMHRVSTITPDERRRIIGNFTGYDISPDMVRLSLVNLYLHGFSDPHIWEYDTLSSEDRWNETFDVILANPPFMSPKGGIRPHKKFSISSNRSEVLFVDYIAEHLNPKGRAGIIVPEGVIFQSGTAYKDLRKMLVENYLYAVVSLPAGVFNPYSGVKTSILLMDREFAKTSEEILFVKIDNDGYGLGAQRNPVKGGQLDDAISVIRLFLQNQLKNTIDCATTNATTDNDTNTGIVETQCIASLPHAPQQTTETRRIASLPTTTPQTAIAHTVPKSEIAKNGDYNLNGERYKNQIIINSDFPIVELKVVADVISGQSPNSEFYNDNAEGLPFYQGKTEFTEMYIGAPTKWTTEITKEAFKNDILMSVRAPVGPVNYATQHICIGRGLAAIRTKAVINKDFLFYLLKSQEGNIKGNGGAVFDSISRNQIESIKIPLPPISVQEEIVAEIEGYQKIIDGAKMVVENYKPKIDIDADWEMVELGEVFNKVNDNVLPIEIDSKTVNYIGLENISHGTGQLVGDFMSNPKDIKSTKIKFKNGDILYGKLRPNLNKVYFSEIEGICSTDIIVIRGKENIDSKFYSSYFLSDFFNQEVLKGLKGAQLPRIGYESFSKIIIPLPPLEIQRQIVSRIEKEQELVNANKQLIELYEQKIKDRIAKVWGEDKTVKLKEQEISLAAEPVVEYKTN